MCVFTMVSERDYRRTLDVFFLEVIEVVSKPYLMNLAE